MIFVTAMENNTPFEPDRTTRYFDRLDEMLAKVKTRASRIAILNTQRVQWEARYRNYQKLVDGPGELPHGGPHPNDYVLTITGLYARIKMEEDADGHQENNPARRAGSYRP